MPVLVANAEGSLTSRTKGEYTLTLAFGALSLPRGGLVVDGKPCPKPVNLKAGDEVSWSV